MGRVEEIEIAVPVRPELRKFYGYHWRYVIRPRILARAGGRCEKCKREGLRLSIAHIDRTPGHDTDDNLAAWCEPCHKKHDYRVWKRKARKTRIIRKDKARPLLEAIV